MTTIAAIAAKAMTAVAAKITDAVADATLVRDVQGDYDTAAGEYALTTVTQTGRAVFQSITPADDMFPGYVVGPTDQLILLEGFTSAIENDRLTIGGVTRTVRAVQDIGGAGVLFNVVAR